MDLFRSQLHAWVVLIASIQTQSCEFSFNRVPSYFYVYDELVFSMTNLNVSISDVCLHVLHVLFFLYAISIYVRTLIYSF